MFTTTREINDALSSVSSQPKRSSKIKEEARAKFLATRFELKTESLCVSKIESLREKHIAEIQKLNADLVDGEGVKLYYYQMGSDQNKVEALIAFHPKTDGDYLDLIEDLESIEGVVGGYIQIKLRTQKQIDDMVMIKERFVENLKKDLQPHQLLPIKEDPIEVQFEEEEKQDERATPFSVLQSDSQSTPVTSPEPLSGNNYFLSQNKGEEDPIEENGLSKGMKSYSSF